MKILLVHPNSVSSGYIVPALASLSAVLKKASHEVEMFDTTFMNSHTVEDNKIKEKNLEFKKVDLAKYGVVKERVNIREEFEKKIMEFEPDLIAASVVSSEFEFLISFLNVVKEKFKDIPILIGGAHPTVAPEEAIKDENVDMICIGEGEEAILELLDKLERGKDISKIKSLWVKKDGKIIKNELRMLEQDLDSLPFPDWDIFDDRHLIKPFNGKVRRFGYFELGRGCAYKCPFCVNSFLHKLYKGKGRWHREKSAKRIIDEIKYMKDKHNFNFVQFTDETLLAMSKEKLTEFADLYKEQVNLPFFMMTRPETLEEDKVKILGSMKLCQMVAIGLESGNEKIRSQVCDKHFSNEQMINVGNLLHKYGIKLATYNMIGLPYENRDQIFDTIKLNKKIKSRPAIFYFFYPFKGTPLRDLCLEEGFIEESETRFRPTVNTILNMPQISYIELQSIKKVIPIYLRTPEFLWPIIKECENGSLFGKTLYFTLINFFELKFNYLEKKLEY